ncbi:hypothetical protein niasHS_012590 [Heterodera schachtii]|uniref:Uncharacterized protein n=1 Tax=Heterodera schachtii TaxID=97005 RepID=A0ABD2IDY9_HETSC
MFRQSHVHGYVCGIVVDEILVDTGCTTGIMGCKLFNANVVTLTSGGKMDGNNIKHFKGLYKGTKASQGQTMGSGARCSWKTKTP